MDEAKLQAYVNLRKQLLTCADDEALKPSLEVYTVKLFLNNEQNYQIIWSLLMLTVFDPR